MVRVSSWVGIFLLKCSQLLQARWMELLVKLLVFGVVSFCFVRIVAYMNECFFARCLPRMDGADANSRTPTLPIERDGLLMHGTGRSHLEIRSCTERGFFSLYDYPVNREWSY